MVDSPTSSANQPFLARRQRFAAVGSTNDVVREWLADGTPEVCLAVADEQTAGRGRSGRSWLAPAGRALLLSLGFRPVWLAPDRVWRLAAIASLAMADAAEEVAELADGAVRLKWPNDLVIEAVDGRAVAGGAVAGPRISDNPTRVVLKVAGVLGETDGLGGDDPRVVIGLGINADWAAADFPPELAVAMTSLREASGGRPIDLATLLDAFLGRLEARVQALRAGRFDAADWTDRQLTTGRTVLLQSADRGTESVHALGVDSLSGALVVADADAHGGERSVLSGEIVHLRVGV